MQKSLPLHQQPLISETKRLADAVASVAATITEPINTKLKAAIESGTDFPRASQANAGSQNAIEGWVKKTDVAKHLNVSLRTINNLMKKGLIPYVRLGGRRVFFKLSEVDETFSRRFKRNDLW
jgi:excisionase family DNA binding protein